MTTVLILYAITGLCRVWWIACRAWRLPLSNGDRYFCDIEVPERWHSSPEGWKWWRRYRATILVPHVIEATAFIWICFQGNWTRIPIMLGLLAPLYISLPVGFVLWWRHANRHALRRPQRVAVTLRERKLSTYFSWRLEVALMVVVLGSWAALLVHGSLGNEWRFPVGATYAVLGLALLKAAVVKGGSPLPVEQASDFEQWFESRRRYAVMVIDRLRWVGIAVLAGYAAVHSLEGALPNAPVRWTMLALTMGFWLWMMHGVTRAPVAAPVPPTATLFYSRRGWKSVGLYILGLAVLLGCTLAWGFEVSSIEGQVVNAVTGAALRKVTLTLAAVGGKADPISARTDDNGRFAFRDLASGRYRLSVERAGFERKADVLLAVEAGKGIQDFVVELAPDAVISGRVVDQEGEPMPNLIVTALKQSYSHGRRQWAPAGGTQTNDRGEYRIAGLRAGRYLVRANNLNIGIGIAGISKEALPETPDTDYAETYFGGATAIDVRMGEDCRGTNIQMTRTSTVRIRGKVIGATEGKQLVLVLLRKGSPQAAGGFGLVQQTDATFEIRGVTPGSYLLMARGLVDAAGAAMPLDVGGRHIEGLEFRIGDTGELAGQVRGGKGASVTIDSVDAEGAIKSTASAGEDGGFVLKNVVAGRYRLLVDDLPDGSYLDFVKLAGKRVDGDELDLSGGISGKLEIALGTSGAEVEGVLLGKDEKPVAGATVVLIPSIRCEWLYRHTTTDQNGGFRVKSIRPGKYKLIAWSESEPGAYLDPEFVRPFENRAQALSLEANGHLQIALQVFPAKEDR